jgi:pilus assembly protein Flp/PilA
MGRIKRFMDEENGQTLVEYGLLISLIALVCIAILTVLGQRLRSGFSAASTAIATSSS